MYTHLSVCVCLQSVRHICDDLYEVIDYPARGFAFQLYDNTVNSMARCHVFP